VKTISRTSILAQEQQSLQYCRILITKVQCPELCGSFRQFDSVYMFLVALVLFCENLVKPMCLWAASASMCREGWESLWVLYAGDLELLHIERIEAAKAMDDAATKN